MSMVASIGWFAIVWLIVRLVLMPSLHIALPLEVVTAMDMLAGIALIDPRSWRTYAKILSGALSGIPYLLSTVISRNRK